MTFEKINWRPAKVRGVYVADFDRSSARVKQTDDGSWAWSVSRETDALQGTAATKIGAQVFAERALRFGAL